MYVELRVAVAINTQAVGGSLKIIHLLTHRFLLEWAAQYCSILLCPMETASLAYSQLRINSKVNILSGILRRVLTLIELDKITTIVFKKKNVYVLAITVNQIKCISHVQSMFWKYVVNIWKFGQDLALWVLTTLEYPPSQK